MKANQQLKIGIILSYLSLVLGNIVSLVYTPVMLRLLGQSEYGLYSLVASFVAYLGLMDLGFGTTYLRFYSQYKHSQSNEDVAKLNGLFLTVFTCIALLILLCGAVMYLYSDKIFGGKLTNEELSLARRILMLIVGNLAFSFWSKVFEIHITANERFVFLKSVGIVRNLINPLIMLPLLLMGYKVYAMAMLALIIEILYGSLCCAYSCLSLKVKAKLQKVERSLCCNIAEVSFFVFIGEVVDQLNWHVGKYILGKTQGTVSVAIFGVASQFCVYYRHFSSCISSVFIPRVNQIIAGGDNNQILSDLMIKIGRIQFAVLMLLALEFTFCGRMFCELWAGQNYSGTYSVALLLMIPTTIPLIQNIGVSILIARKKHIFRSVCYLLFAILNVLVSIPLCIHLKEIGGAIGTALSMLIGNGLVINWYYHRIGLDIGGFWKSITSLALRGLTIPIAFGFAILLFPLPLNWLCFFCVSLILLLIYVLSMFLFGLNVEEKNFLFSSISRYFGPKKAKC